MRRRVAIVADDLTGATDTGVQFAQAKWSSGLLLGEATPDRMRRAHASVVTVTTDSRACDAEEAAARVSDAIAAARAAGFDRLYKKVDSTLRGPVRAEVEAARAAWGDDAIAVVCPAFPGAGRTVVDGVLLVDGVPASETSLASDPVTPITESHVPTLVGGVLVDLSSVDGAAAQAEALRAAGPIVVVDASTDEDLLQLGRAVAALGDDALPVGAAGLAAALAEAWQPEPRSGPVLVLVSSQNPASLAQANALRSRDGVVTFTAPGNTDAAAWTSWGDEVAERFDRDAAGDPFDVALVLAPPRDTPLDPSKVRALLGQTVARVVLASGLSGIVLVGGDGARSTLHEMGARGIDLHQQIGAGVPSGAVVGGEAEGLPIVTKAGGFGDPDILSEITQWLHEQEVDR